MDLLRGEEWLGVITVAFSNLFCKEQLKSTPSEVPPSRTRPHSPISVAYGDYTQLAIQTPFGYPSSQHSPGLPTSLPAISLIAAILLLISLLAHIVRLRSSVQEISEQSIMGLKSWMTAMVTDVVTGVADMVALRTTQRLQSLEYVVGQNFLATSTVTRKEIRKVNRKMAGKLRALEKHIRRTNYVTHSSSRRQINLLKILVKDTLVETKMDMQRLLSSHLTALKRDVLDNTIQKFTDIETSLFDQASTFQDTFKLEIAIAQRQSQGEITSNLASIQSSIAMQMETMRCEIASARDGVRKQFLSLQQRIVTAGDHLTRMHDDQSKFIRSLGNKINVSNSDIDTLDSDVLYIRQRLLELSNCPSVPSQAPAPSFPDPTPATMDDLPADPFAVHGLDPEYVYDINVFLARNKAVQNHSSSILSDHPPTDHMASSPNGDSEIDGTSSELSHSPLPTMSLAPQPTTLGMQIPGLDALDPLDPDFQEKVDKLIAEYDVADLSIGHISFSEASAPTPASTRDSFSEAAMAAEKLSLEPQILPLPHASTASRITSSTISQPTSGPSSQAAFVGKLGNDGPRNAADPSPPFMTSKVASTSFLPTSGPSQEAALVGKQGFGTSAIAGGREETDNSKVPIPPSSCSDCVHTPPPSASGWIAPHLRGRISAPLPSPDTLSSPAARPMPQSGTSSTPRTAPPPAKASGRTRRGPQSQNSSRPRVPHTPRTPSSPAETPAPTTHSRHTIPQHASPIGDWARQSQAMSTEDDQRNEDRQAELRKAKEEGRLTGWAGDEDSTKIERIGLGQRKAAKKDNRHVGHAGSAE